MAKFVDANIILRYLLDDPEADSVERIFKKQKEIIVADIVIAEVIWTFTTFYKWRKDRFIPKIKSFLSPDFIKADKKILNVALDIFEKYKIDYIDAYLISLMEKKKVQSIYSFDRDFDKVQSVRRIEPK
ncbi:hypothetical protein A2V80_03380 [Candidatus Woesebacteria bacterium RBG_16_39_8b]|uniref:PIN domain-containing protein n=1 Tax=Candidatus Woesebacteria bacterium RBG_16_39_8b TaxID=1802482 RepID=A0A1F7X885_9BACT|nr:MAG: hypothetical protein A2V80_03380 [Candidatus Woesebacteria bacterium RBG_16_39_8b]